MHNEYLAMAYDEVDQAKAIRLRECATDLFFRVQPDGSKRLERTNFCRVRLCPICQWRRGLKTFTVTRKILSAMGDRWKYIFLTLTVRNCQPEELDATLTNVLQSWSRLAKTKEYKAAVHGHMRTVEITHNLEDDTYHPHIHALLAVRPTYFKNKAYITQARWTELWRRSARLGYTPIVNIEACKGTQPHQLAEAAKYAVKVGDYLEADDWQMTVETVRLLDKVLANRRFIAYGGLMAETKRKLGLEDPDDGDLVNVDEDADKPAEGKRVCYSWVSGYRQYLRER